jgi:hypothetical protein
MDALSSGRPPALVYLFGAPTDNIANQHVFLLAGVGQLVTRPTREQFTGGIQHGDAPPAVFQSRCTHLLFT